MSNDGSTLVEQCGIAHCPSNDIYTCEATTVTGLRLLFLCRAYSSIKWNSERLSLTALRRCEARGGESSRRLIAVFCRSTRELACLSYSGVSSGSGFNESQLPRSWQMPPAQI